MTSPIRGLRVGESVSSLHRDPVGSDDPVSKGTDDGPAPVLTRTTSAALLAAALAMSAGGATVLAADPPTTTDPGAAAAGWIATQVEAGVGPGSLADAIFAYAATGVGAVAAADALARLEAGVGGYILSGSDLLPGNLAKTMLAVQVAGGDVGSFGGHDLEADLRGLLITTPGDDLGRFGSALNSDQAYAILALSRTGGGAPSESVDWLVAAQCPNGDFQWDGSCPGAGLRGPRHDRTRAPGPHRGWCERRRGDVHGPAPRHPGSGRVVQLVRTPRTRTARASPGQALRAAGQTAAANDAAAWVLTLQYGCDAPRPRIAGRSRGPRPVPGSWCSRRPRPS